MNESPPSSLGTLYRNIEEAYHGMGSEIRHGSVIRYPLQQYHGDRHRHVFYELRTLISYFMYQRLFVLIGSCGGEEGMLEHNVLCTERCERTRSSLTSAFSFDGEL